MGVEKKRTEKEIMKTKGDSKKGMGKNVEARMI